MVAIAENGLILPPEGFATGCLPRESKIGDVCDLYSKKLEVVPRDKWKSLIGQISLRHHVDHIFSQRNIGSCAAESTSQASAIIRSCQNQPFVRLNPWTLYRLSSGGRDNGSNIDTNLEKMRDIGVLPESYWPRSKGWNTVPPDGWRDIAKLYRVDEFFDITSILEVGSALLKRFPVVFGWRGHSCVLVELLSETRALYANSWDDDWGDDGFGTIYLNEINFGYGVFAVRTVYGTAA